MPRPAPSPPLDVDGHHLRNALRLALASAAAYDDDPIGALGPEFPEVRPLRSGPACGVVAAGPSHVVVAFRGTDGPRDWLDNLRALQAVGFGGRVHRGFADQFRRLDRAMIEAVRSLRDAGQPIWVAGHSLGGALATLATIRLAEEGLRPVACHTFGSPRVLDPSAARAFEGIGVSAFRFVNRNDPVPHAPPPGVIHRFEHVGRLVHLLDGGRIGDGGADWARIALRMARLASPVRGPGGPSVADHMIGAYIRRIARLVRPASPAAGPA